MACVDGFMVLRWNVYQHAHGLLGPKVPPVEKAPVLMLRPRAWNMTEHNVLLGTRGILIEKSFEF